MKRLIMAILMAICLAPLDHAYGQKQPTIERLADGDMIPIRAMVRRTTLIALPEGEEILEVTCGDREYFVIEGKGSHVHLKPAKEGAVTNLHIVAKSGAVYSFLVEEISGPKGRPAKEKADLIIRVNPVDREQLKKDKDNLTEALSRAERELKAEKEASAVQRRGQTCSEEGAGSASCGRCCISSNRHCA